jgi:hypothetical protein
MPLVSAIKKLDRACLPTVGKSGKRDVIKLA